MKVEQLTEDQAVKTYDFPIEFKVHEEGTQLVPSSATITVKDPDGDEQVGDAAMVVAVAGTMTYSLSSTYTAALWENAIIEIEYVISTVTYKAVFFFDVVLNKLKCDVTDADLLNYEPDFAAEEWPSQDDYDPQIQEAFLDVKQDIKNKGKRPSLLIDGRQLRKTIIFKTLEIIFMAFAKSTEDVNWEKYLKYKTAYETQFAALVIKYDEDEDALIDEDEKAQLVSQVNFLR